MNVVNHPTEVQAGSAATVAHIGNVDSGIVPEGSAELMQQASSAPDKILTANPPEAASDTATAEAAVNSTVPVTHAAMHELSVSVMVTLNMTDPRMHDLKSELSSVTVAGQQVNLYNPLRKGGKKSEANPAPEGIVRVALNKLLNITDAINSNRILMVGQESEINANLRNAIDATRNQIVALIPGAPNAVVATLATEDEEAIELRVSDIVKVSSWINSPQPEAGTADVIASHNAIINLTVASGMLYDTQEPAKQIAQIENILRMVQAKREDSSTSILLAVNLDPSSLSDAATRELLDSLLDELGFALYTRNELNRLDAADWLPQTIEAVNNDMLAPTGDLLLVRLLADEEEGEGEDGDDAGASE